MNLSELIKPERVFLDVEARDHDDLMRELARLLAQGESHLEEGELLKGLMDREALGGTMTGGGIILPHARVAPPGEEVVALARLERPIPIDGETVWLAAVTVTDPDHPQRHLQLLSQLAKVLHQKPCLKVLRNADDREAVALVLAAAASGKERQYKLFLAVLPDDEAVYDFLNALAEIGVQGATSVTARGMGEILSSGPTLFAGFRELFGAVGSARLVFSALEEALLEPAIGAFRKIKEERDIFGVAFHLPLDGVVGLER